MDRRVFLCKIAISILYRCLFRNPACFLVSFLWQLNPCKGKLEQLRESLEVPAPELPKPGISLGNWLDHWYQTYKRASLRPNTQMSYERWIYQHIIHALGSIQLDKLTAGNIQQS